MQGGDADAGVDHQGAVVHAHRLVQVAEDALGDLFGAPGAAGVDQQHHEFVAAEAEQVVSGAQALREPAADLDQHAVAEQVAEAVVDELEAVQVDEQHRCLAAAGVVQLALGMQEQLVQPQAVGQPGQRVVAGGVVQLVFDGLAPADVALRAGDAQLSVAVGLGHAAAEHPQPVAIAAADAVFVVDPVRFPVQVRVDGLVQAGQVVGMDPGKPGVAGLAQGLPLQPDHVRPALGHVQGVRPGMPVPDPVMGATQGPREARLAVLQRLALGGAVGVDGQGHVEEHGLEQAGEKLHVGALAAQRRQHLLQVQPVGGQVPLQLDAVDVVDQADAQAVVDVVAVVGPLPQPLVVLQLPLLQPVHGARVAEQRGRGGEVIEVAVQPLDECGLRGGHARGVLVQAPRVVLAPFQQAAAFADFRLLQPDSPHQLLQCVDGTHGSLLR